MKIYNRKTKELEEIKQYGGNLLELLYGKVWGRILLKFIVNPIFSRINGIYNSSQYSRKKIEPFIQDYQIKMDDFESVEYKSFNDFFTRKIRLEARPMESDDKKLISPADSKLSVYRIGDNLNVKIKGSNYTLDELVDGRVDINSYKGGLCLVFRLTMDDYHRYCFPDDGILVAKHVIKGKLHTVSSISKKYKIYKENSRVINLLKTKHFDEILFIEVGALLVGKIVNRSLISYGKGQEKGYFELGGSTIVMLMKEGTVSLDADIMEYAAKGTEVKVHYRETIGRKR